MKTDAQVLDEAIATLEKEGMWCQGSWVKYQVAYDGDGSHRTVIGMCAEGAIRTAVGCAFEEHQILGQLVPPQAERIENKVIERLAEIRPDVLSGYDDDVVAANVWAQLSNWNDHGHMRASDIILAMKQAREELA